MHSFYRESCIWLALMVTVLAAGICELASAQPLPPVCPGALDYVDSTHGGRVRQIYKPDGHEHNLYHYRNPWNANNTSMVGIREDLDHTDWRVVLSDGNGCFLKELYPISQYSWQVVWDRHDPNILYTWRSTRLYRYHVSTGQAELLKDYQLTGNAILVPPTLNQVGDRILVVTSGKVFRSYHLPDMTDERAFTVPGLPPQCDARNVRYIGYQNYIAVDCRNESTYGSAIYSDTGVLVKKFSRGIGHTDFSPTGQWAYFTLTSNQTVEVHVVNLDGTNDRLLYTTQGKFQNLHITWPDQVSDWFVVSFFGSSYALPPTYAPPFDEILLLHTDGSQQWLARTRSVDTPGGSFWAQPQASPSGDGSRISFNSDCFNAAPGVDCTDSATVDHYILFTELSSLPLVPLAEANGPYSGQVGSPVKFSSAGSTGPNSNVVSYSWNFGDGTPPSNQPNPTHIYSVSGTFTATLKVVDNQGAIGTDISTVKVSTKQPGSGRGK